MSSRSVAVFDAEFPPGMAFIRSLGRAGLPTVAYSSEPRAAGRYSRYTSSFRPCPSLSATDEFIAWMAAEMATGRIDLVAPTSDYIVFNASEAARSIGGGDVGQPASDRLLDCLFKLRFATALANAGFPSLPTAGPTTLEEALEVAEKFGYPVVLKARSHIGVGRDRGVVIRCEESLRRLFAPFEVGQGHSSALAVDPDLAIPLVQQYRELNSVEVISVSGCLDLDGSVLALEHSRKTHAWPPRLGIGTQFETVPEQHFTDHVVDAVRQILGSGLFELEVLVDRRSNAYWAIDLNPRGFGQMMLDIRRGNDLPLLWYRSRVRSQVRGSGTHHTRDRPPGRRRPTYWRMGVAHYAGAFVRLLRSDHRRRHVVEMIHQRRAPSVGPVWDRADPLPGVVWAWRGVRHPGGLVRPYLKDTEVG